MESPRHGDSKHMHQNTLCPAIRWGPKPLIPLLCFPQHIWLLEDCSCGHADVHPRPDATFLWAGCTHLTSSVSLPESLSLFLPWRGVFWWLWTKFSFGKSMNFYTVWMGYNHIFYNKVWISDLDGLSFPSGLFLGILLQRLCILKSCHSIFIVIPFLQFLITYIKLLMFKLLCNFYLHIGLWVVHQVNGDPKTWPTITMEQNGNKNLIESLSTD